MSKPLRWEKQIEKSVNNYWKKEKKYFNNCHNIVFYHWASIIFIALVLICSCFLIFFFIRCSNTSCYSPSLSASVAYTRWQLLCASLPDHCVTQQDFSDFHTILPWWTFSSECWSFKRLEYWCFSKKTIILVRIELSVTVKF